MVGAVVLVPLSGSASATATSPTDSNVLQILLEQERQATAHDGSHALSASSWRGSRGSLGSETLTENDPSGDTAPVEECRTDIVPFGGDYFDQTVTVGEGVVCGSDPRSDPHWEAGHTGIVWFVDVNGDGNADFDVFYVNDGTGNVVAEVRVHTGSSTLGSLVCSATPGWDGDNRFVAQFPASCIGSPASYTVAVAMVWDDNPGGASCTCPSDVAPDSGFSAPVAQSSSAPPHLQYYGGNVVSHINVQGVYWGAGTYESGVGPAAAPIVNFFRGVLDSPYADSLSEYDTLRQSVGRGSYRGQTTISVTAPNSGSTINDANIQAELKAQLASGAVPPPQLEPAGNDKTVYAVFIPQGITVTLGGATGGEPGGFCAYHSTIVYNGTNVPYMVLPDFADPSRQFGTGCGTDPSLYNNFTITTAHELIEVVTDPDAGLVTTDPSGIAGWYDPNNGEIADICIDQQGTVVGGDGNSYVVQQQFSNTVGQCVTTRPVPAPPRTGYVSACRSADPTAFPDAGLAADCLKLYGVALGKNDGTFGENDGLLRSQVSSLLVRTIQMSGAQLTGSRSFPDVNPDTVPNDQVRTEIEQLAGSGIIAGLPDGLFHPADQLSVAQAATLVIRTLQYVHAQQTAAPDIHDQGTTTANYDYATTLTLLDPYACDIRGFQYPNGAGNTTNRGLLADTLARSVQLLIDSSVVAQR